MNDLSSRGPLGQKKGKPKPNPRRLERVKMMPCIICNAPPPSDAHHCIHDRFSQRRASDDETIPLCKACHQDGPDAIHNGKETWRKKYGPDWRYLPSVDRKLAREDDESLGDWF